MYLKTLSIENVGPIDFIDVYGSFSSDGSPRPLIFVGKNGSGKSIVLSFLVNALLYHQAESYQDTEVDQGRVYKLRSPLYIAAGKKYYSGRVDFDSGVFVSEIQAVKSKSEFEREYNFTPANRLWNEMAESDSSIFRSNMAQIRSSATLDFKNSVSLFFPPNRFEEPAWLNVENLKNKSDFQKLPSVKGFSGRRIIQHAPLRDNQSWLLDVAYDSFAIETKFLKLPNEFSQIPNLGTIIADGPASRYRSIVETFIEMLLGLKPDKWILGKRGYRYIAFSKEDKYIINNIFALSTGQTSLLNIFLSILRDFDNTSADFQSLSSIKGIVVIDEVDLHLHSELQFSGLPKLISLFPGIQFVLTTHSPLFLMGMKNTLGSAFDILDLPSGRSLEVERFAEFESAYDQFRKTSTYIKDMSLQIDISVKPILFLEGEIDISYVNAAAIALNKTNILERFKLIDANGFGGLHKIWKSLDNKIADALHQRVLLLYDCDVDSISSRRGKIARMSIPQSGGQIQKGIENLLSNDVIGELLITHPHFFDIISPTKIITRGVESIIHGRIDVNTHEKKNLMEYITSRTERKYFEGFSVIFDLLEDFLKE